MISSLDWSLVQVFLAVAETGSLSAAARRLRVSQPTVGRHVQVIEDRLGAELFQRQTRGMALTDLGAALVEPARAMQAASGEFALRAAGGSGRMAGTVRITASVFTAHHILPPIIADLVAAEPEIAVDVVASDATENLLFREADIAVRMYRPTQLDVVTRHIGDIPLGLFGARSYLDRKGRPASREDLLSHDFVGYDRSEEIIRGFREAGWAVDRDFFRVRCDNQAVYWELVRAGCGLGFSQKPAVTAGADMEEIEMGVPLPILPVWLTAHEAMRKTPRVRRVWDLLAERLQRVVS